MIPRFEALDRASWTFWALLFSIAWLLLRVAEWRLTREPRPPEQVHDDHVLDFQQRAARIRQLRTTRVPRRFLFSRHSGGGA